jgi:arylsulfatase A
MKKIKFVFELTSLAGCVLIPATGIAQKATSKHPNIIYILADDLGYGELGCYGQTKIKTPNLDRMAANGIRFTQNYSGSSVSGPSRSCLFTGQHTGYAWTRENSPIDDPLPVNAVTFGAELKKLGYVTGVFGKWGAGKIGTTGVPWLQGFDTFFGYLAHREAHNYYPDNLYSNSTLVPLNNSGVNAHPSNKVSPANDSTQYLQFIGKEWSNTRIKDEAIKFIQSNRSQKFMAYMPFTVPHMALQAPLDSLEKYYGRKAFGIETPYAGGNNYTPCFKPRSMYATMITLLDIYVGQIEAELKAQHLDTCTLIMFSSDNGSTNPTGGSDTPFFNSTGGLRGTKYSWYEGGIRVPLIVYWPGHVPAGVTSDLITHIEDILPTVLEVAGGTVPASSTGISLVPTILPNGTKQKEHTHLYWESSNSSNALQAVRVGKWKLHRQNIRKGEKYELYNLETDEKETYNVAAIYPDTVARLKQYMSDRVNAHLATWNFPLPSNVSVHEEGIAAQNNALQFNGTNDWIELTGYKGIGGSNPRTVEAWIKTAAIVPGEIITWGANSSGKKWAIRLDHVAPNVGKLRVEGGSSYVIGTQLLNDGKWHHVAVSYAGGNLSTAKLYVDGESEPITFTSDVALNTDTVTGMSVQISKGYSNRFWNGELDEIRLWNTARTAQEIAANYNCPIIDSEINDGEVPESSTGLVHYYDFNRDSATILPDIRGIAKGYLMNMSSTSWKISQAVPCAATAIKHVNNNTKFCVIKPNPNSGYFQIESRASVEEPIDIDIYNSKGTLVYSKHRITNVSHEIKLKKGEKGVFMVRVREKRGISTGKVTVK